MKATLRVEEFTPEHEHEPYLIARLVAGEHHFILDVSDGETIPDMQGPETGDHFIAEMTEVAKALGVPLEVDEGVTAILEDLRQPDRLSASS